MNCVNGHSVLESMKFCSVCGVSLAQQVQPTEQPEQSSPGFAYNPPQLREVAKKKSNRAAIGVILGILFLAWLSNRGGDAEATIQEQYLAEIKAKDSSAFVSNDAALLYLKNYCQAAETVRMVASDPIDAIVTSYCNTQLATDLGVTQAPTPDASEPITQETPIVRDAVPWSDYSPTLKGDLDSLASASNCQELQSQFDVADQNNQATMARTGHNNADLMGYIDSLMQNAGCY